MELQALYEIYSGHPVICTDTRNIQPGCLFFALKGTNFDGNQFALDALEKGAAYAVVSDTAIQDRRCIHVTDTLETLQKIANYHRRHFNIPVIAITGSNGKTTTKELVTNVLSLKFRTHATVGNLNNHIGVPLTLLRMQPDTEIAVIEMGANHIGEIKSLCSIAMPTHGLITNIGKAHLEGFGSIEGVKKAKGELFDYLKEFNGHAFVNADDHAVRDLAKDLIEKTIYGFDSSHGPQMLFKYLSAKDNDGFIIEDEENDVVIKSSMFGHYNAINMVAALTVGKHFDVAKEAMVKSLTTFVPGANRSEVISHKGCTIIKDAYNANPSSMELALYAFAERFKNGRVVLGSMKELGLESESAHAHILQVARSLNFDHIFLIGEEFGLALTTANLQHATPFTLSKNIEELMDKWKWENCEGKAILLKGSRSMRLEKLLEN
jgi:UDP-N-acetylmuramoyl-tripeptide--D-alanyl-D-alanine ligase